MARRKQAKRTKNPAKNKTAKLRDLKVKKGGDVRGGADWTGMKTYSVWEASRKVLINPENFLQPEGRPTKSSAP
jgi:hypothetical protein